MPADPDEYFADVLVHASPGGGPVVIGRSAQWDGWWRRVADGLGDELPPDLVRAAGRQGFVLTTAQLAGAGIPRHRVRREVANGRWQVVQRGIVAPVAVRPGVTDHLAAQRHHALACAGAAMANRGHVVCGASAAVLRGLPVFDLPKTPQLTVVPTRGTGRRRTREAVLHREDLDFWWGTAVTAVARTVADLARHDRWDAVMAGDAALREGLVDGAALAAVGDRMPRWPGIAQARRLLPLLDPASESPLESMTRLRLRDDGFPPPLLQVPIEVPGRRVPYRVDMLWPEQRVILEIDGLGKYSAVELRRERRREAELRALGYRIERVMWHDVVAEWPRTAALLRRALGL